MEESVGAAVGFTNRLFLQSLRYREKDFGDTIRAEANSSALQRPEAEHVVWVSLHQCCPIITQLIPLAVATDFFWSSFVVFSRFSLRSLTFRCDGKHLENISDQERFKLVQRDGLFFRSFESNVNFTPTCIFSFFTWTGTLEGEV